MQSFESVTNTNHGQRNEGQAAKLAGPIGRVDPLAESVEIEACKDLWLAVLEQAVKDARGTRRYYSIVEEAREWFRSEDENPGSFLWVCRILFLDPAAIRDAVERDYCSEAA